MYISNIFISRITIWIYVVIWELQYLQCFCCGYQRNFISSIHNIFIKFIVYLTLSYTIFILGNRYSRNEIFVQQSRWRFSFNNRTKIQQNNVTVALRRAINIIQQYRSAALFVLLLLLLPTYILSLFCY